VFLIDTNIILEILLKQDKAKVCKEFMTKNIGKINLSVFSLHSIGVILLRLNKENSYARFLGDILPGVRLVFTDTNV